MSLFGKVLKAAGSALKSGIAKKLVGGAAMIPGPIGLAGKALGVASTIGTAVTVGRAALPTIGKVAGRVLPTVGKVAGAAATGYAIYDAAGNYLGNRKRSRRINPMNYRAANRALKRIEKAKKLMDRLGRISIRKEKC